MWARFWLRGCRRTVRMRIALDAMGGDHAPGVVVAGGVQAAHAYGVGIVLVGRDEAVQAELADHDTTGLNLSVIHASQVIGMAEHPALAVKSKKDASIVVGMKLVRQGGADALASAGNTGGILAAALLHLGRIKGVKRPALCAVIPTEQGVSLP